MQPGPRNAITDVPGIRVGQVTRTEDGWLTGTTVVLPPEGTVGGVDVRGGAPGTRETDLLAPENLVDRVDAVVLTGGSAFGLAAADGVMQALYAAGLGHPMGEPGEVVPIVPAAVIFDLGRGGAFASHPGPADGAEAVRQALGTEEGAAVTQGSVGAGTGAKAGALRGGVGTASAVLDDGATVAALVVANPVGWVADRATGELRAAREGLAGEFEGSGRLSVEVLADLEERVAAQQALLRPGSATCVGVVATDAALSKAQCRRLATAGHDGLARAVSPVHTLLDGDTVFALATGSHGVPDLLGLLGLEEAAASCMARAVGHAVLAATSSHGDVLEAPSWQELAGPTAPAADRH